MAAGEARGRGGGDVVMVVVVVWEVMGDSEVVEGRMTKWWR